MLCAGLVFFTIHYSFSQAIGIGTINPDSSAILDITHSSKGLLIPRMNTSSILSITAPAKGLLVYDTLTNQLMVNTGNSTAPSWQPIAGNTSQAWNLTGNSGINPTGQFIGTTDNTPFRFRINNIQAGELNPTNGNISWGIRAGLGDGTFSNIAIGTDALKLSTLHSNLVAIGDSALFNNGDAIFNTAVGSKALFTNTTGSSNTALGFETLEFTTTGSVNTAVGTRSMNHNTTGRFNTGTGFSTLFFNSSGEANTATGNQSLLNNTSGNDNTGTGSETLKNNLTGNLNTAMGSQAAFMNTTGAENTASGAQALFFNAIGNDNTALGFKSLNANTGSFNTSVGAVSLIASTTGNFNAGLGYRSLLVNTTGFQNTAVGATALATNDVGSSNTAIGFGADVSIGNLTNATAIGQGAIVDASNKIRLGNSAVTVIEGQVPFTTPSDGRFKFHIQEDVKGLDFIMNLRPVTYQFDVKRFDEMEQNGNNKMTPASTVAYEEATSIRRSGFIAQEVEKAAQTSGYNFSGIIQPKTVKDHYSLSYESFVVPLVKAVQEQQQEIEELKKRNANLEQMVKRLLQTTRH